MRLKHLPTLLVTVLPLVIGDDTRGGPGGNIGAGDHSGSHGQGQNHDQSPSRGSGSGFGSGTGPQSTKNSPGKKVPDRDGAFLITSYNALNQKQYFTQPKSPSNPWMLYQTPLQSQAEIFRLTEDNVLWYNSTNPELPGPLYSFFYTDKLDEPSELRYVGFWIKEGIEDPENGIEYFRWEVDLEEGTLEVVYPEDLVFATCPVEIEGLDGERNEWFVSKKLWKGEEEGCRRIEVGIEPVLGGGRG